MRWQVVGASARGASHVRSGRPNQDAMAWLPADDQGPAVAVAVADGHGSPKCFRSDAGARFAVKLATQILTQFAAAQPAGALPAEIDSAAQKLPETLVSAWRDAVMDALQGDAFTSAELEALEAESGVAARRTVEASPVVAYGATLLGALVTQAYILYLQLGDGDILTVSNSGEVARPVPGDERLFANETTSLCLPEAWRAARTKLDAPATVPPALILMSTDGYANSFGQDADFLKVGTDLLDIVRSDGVAAVQDSLPAWLADTSSGGSGDDITLTMICRQDICGSQPPPAIVTTQVAGPGDGIR
jgi:hypothetical protein